jgi:CheY-like chemotaxis protein
MSEILESSETRNRMQNLPILLAEDSDDDIFLMERAFKKARLTNPLKVVSDGEQAMAYLKGDGEYADRDKYPFPALVLLDIKMPRMNGLEVLSAIRQDPQLKRLVVIFLTASNLEKDVNLAFDLQANSYLVKPSDTDGMVNTLDKVKDYWLSINQYPHCPPQEAA